MKFTYSLIIAISTLSVSVTGITATITINNNLVVTADDGFCTLPEAMVAANDNLTSGLNDGECAAGETGLDEIVFNLPLGQTDIKTGNILIPTVLEPLIINGPGADLLAIDAEQEGYLFTLRADFTLSGLSLINGMGYAGNAIYQYEGHDLTLSDCIIRNHYAEDNFGGAVRIVSSVNTNHVSIKNCQFIDNYSPKNGGAVYLNVSPNRHLVVSIDDSVFLDNESVTRGGGALGGGTPVDGTLSLQINNSRFENNDSGEGGGGIYLSGLNITGSITNSAFIGNHAGYGGGAVMWYKTGEFSSINNTFHNNTANNYAGALYLYADIDNAAGIHIINNTITGNHILSDQSSFGGGGLYSRDNKTKVSNSVIANNSAMNEAPDCSGTLGSAGFNLISDTTDCNFIADPTDMLGDDTLPLDPMLNLLIDDGDSNVYQAPMEGSPLIDAGNPVGCINNLGNRINYDQLGQFRHQDGSDMGVDRCDIGAVEIINSDVIFKSLFE